MYITPGILAFYLASQGAVAFMCFSAWRGNLFLQSQIVARYGREGIPVIAHGGMWSDMFLLPLLMCYMLLHSGSWSSRRDWIPFAIALAITTGNQVLLSHSTRPDPLGFTDMKSSTAIIVHFVYMVTYITIIGHFFFNPVDVSPTAIVVVCVLLGVHVAAGTHVFAGLIAVITDGDPYYKSLLYDKILPYMNAGVWVLLGALAGFATGSRTVGAIVAGIGLTAIGGISLFAAWFQPR